MIRDLIPVLVVLMLTLLLVGATLVVWADQATCRACGQCEAIRVAGHGRHARRGAR